MTQEFHLSITSLGSDRYLIRTEDTVAAVPIAEAQVDWPVDEWLKLSQPAMDDPLVGLLQGKVDLSDRGSELHQLGSKLHNALFQDDSIRESWLSAQVIARHQREVLRLRLGLKESRLQRLPWEVLQQGGQPMTTRSDMTFVRYAASLLAGQTHQIQNLPESDSPIQVLFVIASPRDQDHLKLLREVKNIQELLASESEEEDTLPIHIDVLEQPDRSQLAQKLEQGSYQVLHYAGHSDFGKNGGDLSLVNRKTGLTEKLSGDDLAGLLVSNHVALTVFNSCRSGHTAGDDAEMDWRQQNLVQALVNRGVPSVIAMAERIPDEIAISFTRLFYSNLRAGFPIDVSLNRTRQGLVSVYGSDQYYWALPILYLQPDFDGYLTQRIQAAAIQSSEITEATHELPTVAAETAAAEAMTAESVAAEAIVAEVVPTEDPAVAPVSSASAHESPTPTMATEDFLTQLDESIFEEGEDDFVASYVEQLSQKSPPADESFTRADVEETLLEETSQRPGMEIYETLPEVPLQQAEAVSVVPPLPQSERDITTAQPQPLTPSVPESEKPSKLEQSSWLAWLSLSAIGVIGVLGLSVLAIRWIENRDTPLPATSQTGTIDAPISQSELGPLDVAALIQEGEVAIAQRRYADARDAFDGALTQLLIGNVNSEELDRIWESVLNTDNSELLYIKGRLAWQQLATLVSAPPGVNSPFEQGAWVDDARAAWAQTDNNFLEGRIARGFAAYEDGDWDEAVDNWEAALAIYDAERARQPDPASSTVADPVILHAYAGLVMAHTALGTLNLAGIKDDSDLRTADADETAILKDESANELVIAEDYFRQLQALDADGQMTPGKLYTIDESPVTWHNWLWTVDLIEDWRGKYRRWSEETAGQTEP